MGNFFMARTQLPLDMPEWYVSGFAPIVCSILHFKVIQKGDFLFICI